MYNEENEPYWGFNSDSLTFPIEDLAPENIIRERFRIIAVADMLFVMTNLSFYTWIFSTVFNSGVEFIIVLVFFSGLAIYVLLLFRRLLQSTSLDKTPSESLRMAAIWRFYTVFLFLLHTFCFVLMWFSFSPKSFKSFRLQTLCVFFGVSAPIHLIFALLSISYFRQLHRERENLRLMRKQERENRAVELDMEADL